jgi:hypothetical protein
MKTHLIILWLLVLTLTYNFRLFGQTKTWQTDWELFTKAYLKEGVNKKQFVGKDVTWQGLITSVHKTDSSLSVYIKMNPSFKVGGFSIDTLQIAPNKDEWNQWSISKQGQVVKFGTHLTGMFGDNDESPVMFFQMNNAPDFAYLFTKGGKLLKIISNVQ